MLLQSAIELRLDDLHTANKHVCLRTVLTQGRLKDMDGTLYFDSFNIGRITFCKTL